MIFYHPDCDLKFSEYGIEIPIVDDRASRVYNELQKLHPELEYTDLKTVEAIKREDLERVHQKEFINRLFGTDEELTHEVMKCYELINAQGEFERYNPANQKKGWDE